MSGATVRAEVVHSGRVGAYAAGLAWAPDGEALAVADDAGTVTVAELGDGRHRDVAEHPGGALAVAWAPSPVLASGGRDGGLGLDGHVRPAGGRGWVERLRWRPDGGLLAAACGRRVQFWTPAGVCRDVSADLPATVTGLDWHPKGIVCAAGTYGGVRLLRANGAAVAQHLRWTGSVLEVAFSPDGRRLAHGNQDASVHFWDLRRGTELEMTGYATKVRELGWSADGRWLATGGGDAVTAWDFHRPGGPEGSRPAELDRHTGPVTALAFRPGGALLATAARDGLVLFWAVGDDDLPVGGTALDEPAAALAWSPAGDQLAVGGADGRVLVVSVAMA